MSRAVIPNHPRKADIERDILAGVSARTVAGRYGIRSYSSVTAYARKLKAKVAAEAKTEHNDVERLVGQLNAIYALLCEHLKTYAVTSGKLLDKGTVEVIREARGCINDIAKLEGIFKPGIQINNIVNATASANAQAVQSGVVPPEQVRAAIFRVMRHHPNARDELAAEFVRLQRQYDAVLIEGEAMEVADAEPSH